ncbi:Bro-N domain-containing protein [Streptomyces sp. N2-109]|uniref:Bro-N domain-containing protein n=1 Tax=Streptomyces gossypii TaxID=2883101 RepID=A0ABT2JN25_9ACTN|nr:Bro-N domain-containing protein [Streptomyces gossypii]MCT2589282.1 Bro-N domain-containing protein [Streptomyces gossypii]
MYEQDAPREQAASQDAINIDDFVYAATGTHVRRLTTPGGEHWFPAADVCRELGHGNTSEALRRHVPEHMRCVVASLISREGWEIPARHRLRKSMVLLSLNGLVRLVNGCVKRECEPFKNWVTEVVVAVQRDGSYSLAKAEVQPRSPDGPTAYAMPQEVVDVIVRLEERNMRLDEEAAADRREEMAVGRELAEAVRTDLVDAVRQGPVRDAEQQRVMLETQQDLARSMAQIAEVLERMERRERGERDERTERHAPEHPPAPQPPRPTADGVLAAWRERLTITDDVWAVAVVLVPSLVGEGRADHSLEALASRTGLTVSRVHDCLRFLQKRQCIRQVHATQGGAPVYVLQHP